MTLSPQETRIVLILVLALVALIIIAIVVGARRRARRVAVWFEPGDFAATPTGAQRQIMQASVRPLPPNLRPQYLADWRALQPAFADDLGGALQRADTLLHQVMEARGYPTSGFDQRAARSQADYGDIVVDYRKAHAIVLESQEARAGTEDLRRGVALYRSLFDRLLDIGESERTAGSRIERDTLEAAIRRQAS